MFFLSCNSFSFQPYIVTGPTPPHPTPLSIFEKFIKGRFLTIPEEDKCWGERKRERCMLLFFIFGHGKVMRAWKGERKADYITERKSLFLWVFLFSAMAVILHACIFYTLNWSPLKQIGLSEHSSNTLSATLMLSNIDPSSLPEPFPYSENGSSSKRKRRPAGTPGNNTRAHALVRVSRFPARFRD